MLVKLNDMAVNDQVVIPLVPRPKSAAMSNKLTAELVTGTTTRGICRIGIGKPEAAPRRRTLLRGDPLA